MGTVELFVCVMVCVSQCQVHQGQFQKSVEAGRSHYETYQNEATKDECWRGAVASLNETCRGLSHTAQQRLAIAFANCHWLSAERQTYECTEEMSIAACTSKMTESAFDVYTQFFNHIEDACFYLQSQLWQEKTERLVVDLSDTSTEAVTKIGESLRRHEILERGQEQSLSNQKQLIESSKKLENQLDSAREEVSNAFSSIQQQAWSFKEQFNEIFISLSVGVDNIHHILTWLLGEFISLERFIIFIVGMVIAYLLTCNKYTARARPLIMVVIVIESVFLERCIVNWYLSGENTTSIMEGLHFILWIVRYTTAFLCLLILMYSYTSYYNYEAINHQLLNKIIEQNRQIKRHLKLETEEVADDPPSTWWFSPVKASTPSATVGIANESVILPTQHPPGITNEAAIIPTQHLSGITNESVILPTQHPPGITNESALIPTLGGYHTPVHSEIGRPDQDSVDGDRLGQDSVDGNQPDSGIDDFDSNTERSKSRYNFRKRCKQRYSSKRLDLDNLKRQSLQDLRRNSNESSLMKTHSSASGHSSYFNTHDITT